MLALALQQIRHRRRILTRSDIIPDVLRRGFQIVEVDLAARDGIHDALRNVITVLGALQAHFGCREVGRIAPVVTEAALDRSEEHTSELQSLMRISYAVFCLKKKKISIKITNKH